MAKKIYDFNTFAGRLSYAIDSIGPSELNRQTGISLAQIHRIANGANTTIDNVVKISQATQFNMHWLAFGEGEQLTMKTVGISNTDFVEVQPYRLGEQFNLNFHFEYLEELSIDEKSVVGWKIDVEPKISNYKKGDDVLILKGADLDDGVFVLKLLGKEVLGHLEPQFNGTCLITTDDKKEPQNLSAEEVSKLDIVGRIVWSSRSE